MTHFRNDRAGGTMRLLPALLLLALLCAVFAGCKEAEPEAPPPANPLDAVPADVPIFTLAKFQEIKVSEIGLQAKFTTVASAPEVIDWYQRHLPPKGWRIVGVVGRNPQQLMARKDRRSVSVSLYEPESDEEPKVMTLNYSTRF